MHVYTKKYLYNKLYFSLLVQKYILYYTILYYTYKRREAQGVPHAVHPVDQRRPEQRAH